jgi:hypothetical protein
METGKQSQNQAASQLSYLELLAYLGMTRHQEGRRVGETEQGSIHSD